MGVIRDKSGVSLMFVLAVMMLLLSIGVSALTAAGLNYGAHLEKRERDKLDLYMTSMEQTVKASLSDTEEKSLVDIDDDSLGDYILRALFLLWYDDKYTGTALPDDVKWVIDSGFPGDNDNDVEYTITLIAHDDNPNSFIKPDSGFNIRVVQEHKYIPSECILCEDPDCGGGDDCGCDPPCDKTDPDMIPLIVNVSGYVTVIIDTYIGGEPAGKSETIYRYSGGVIEEQFGSVHTGNAPLIEDMRITSIGSWNVVSYETKMPG